MENNFIMPLNSMFTNTLTQSTTKTADNTQPFQEIFQSAIKNVQESNQEVKELGTRLSLGQSDVLHQATIASTQAEMALKYLVQIRNKGHDAYSEIMRMGV